jgi:SAM-dependent methyltransferase
VFANRADADPRISKVRFRFCRADGHNLPFGDRTFGHLVCFDSLHHMADCRKVIVEMFRVLENGGRVVFVEPGAKHSSSKETREFIELYKKDDPSWLEKDIVLEEILRFATEAGFKIARIIPHLLPKTKIYDIDKWVHFVKEGRADQQIGLDYVRHLMDLNYNGRVIFYLQK